MIYVQALCMGMYKLYEWQWFFLKILTSNAKYLLLTRNSILHTLMVTTSLNKDFKSLCDGLYILI